MKFFTSLFLLTTMFVSSRYSFAQSITLNGSISNAAEQLSKKLVSLGGTPNVAVINFTDKHGNVTELGSHLAEVLSVNLSNFNLNFKVIDRDATDKLAEEIERVLNNMANATPEDKAKLEHITYFITGTTTLLEKSVNVTIKILDFRKGVLMGGMTPELPRTIEVDNLSKSVVRSYSNNSQQANSNIARKLETYNKSSIDDLFGATISDLRPGECYTKQVYTNEKIYYGQVCFENQTGEDIMFFCEEANPEGWLTSYKVIIPNGGSNCSRLIAVNYNNGGQNGVGENTSKQAGFYFYSLDERRRAKQAFIIDKCKVKSMVLTKQNLVLAKPY